MLVLSDERLAHLNQHLSDSIETIVHNLPQIPQKKSQIVINQITFELQKLLEISLTSERERYISEMSAALEQVTKERDDLYQELSEYKTKMRRDNDFLFNQNIDYIERTTALKRELRKTKWQKIQRNTYLEDVISEKEYDLKAQKKLLKYSRQYHKDFVLALQEIRQQQLKNNKKVHTMLQKAKSCLTELCKQQIAISINKAKEEEAKKNIELQQQIQKASQENEDLKHTISIILDTILEMTPNSVQKPNITSNNIVNNVPAFRNYLLCCISAQKQEAMAEMKKNLQISLPELDFQQYSYGSHQTMTSYDIIQRVVQYVQDKQETEQKKNKEIEKLTKQIETMKEKLNVTIDKINKPEYTSRKPSIIQTIMKNDEMLSDQDEWETTRQKLDDTIMKLSKYSSPPAHVKLPDE